MDLQTFILQNPLAAIAGGWLLLQGWRLRHEILTKSREEEKAETEDLHQQLKLFFGNGGGELIRRIVREEIKVVIDRFEKHELTEPERFREILEGGKRARRR